MFCRFDYPSGLPSALISPIGALLAMISALSGGVSEILKTHEIEYDERFIWNWPRLRPSRGWICIGIPFPRGEPRGYLPAPQSGLNVR